MTKRLYQELAFACVDIGRRRRRGFPEVVYCESKTPEQIIKISRAILKYGGPLLLTRLKSKVFIKVKQGLPQISYNPLAKVAYFVREKLPAKKGRVLIVTAGTSDIPTAEEAAVTLSLMGSKVDKLYDVGVAGVHRIMDKKERLNAAAVIIVIAGMEGALASMVSGMVSAPVIAVPTSCGYGSSFKGLSALLTMLNSCSPGVAVVNIDNGFGAGYFAGMINR
ncbi:MAG: nickel pincer cofactor biosynthesis protein LarB [Candidatus Omnitrophota bacterium]